MLPPAIISATPVRRFRLGNHEAVLLSDTVARGSIRYAFVLAVTHDGQPEPCLYVTLEEKVLADPAAWARMRLPEEPAVDTHFLCVFDEAWHHNLGATSTLAPIEAFAARALGSPARVRGDAGRRVCPQSLILNMQMTTSKVYELRTRR